MGNYPKNRRRNYPNEKVDRNAEMLKIILTYDYTLEDLGAMYNLTRERIRQIHFRATGIPYKGRLQKLKAIRTEQAIQKEFEIAYNCKSCRRGVQYIEVKSLCRRKFCPECRAITKETGRDILHPQDCELTTCRREFFPFRNRVGQQRFCSAKCWGQWRFKISGIPHPRRGLTRQA